MNEQQQQPVPIYDSQAPSKEGERLLSLFADMESKQLTFLDDSSKSIIERIATFLAVLFAITAFGNNFPPPYLRRNVTSKWLIFLTLALYLLAMAAGIWAIQPRYYKYYQYNVSRLKEELDKITRHKMRWLRIAGILFALGSIALAILIISIIWPI